MLDRLSPHNPAWPYLYLLNRRCFYMHKNKKNTDEVGYLASTGECAAAPWSCGWVFTKEPRHRQEPLLYPDAHSFLARCLCLELAELARTSTCTFFLFLGLAR